MRTAHMILHIDHRTVCISGTYGKSDFLATGADPDDSGRIAQ